MQMISDAAYEDLYSTAMDGMAAEWVAKNYDLTPAGIIKALDLLNENYEKLAEGCHYRYGGTV